MKSQLVVQDIIYLLASSFHPIKPTVDVVMFLLFFNFLCGILLPGTEVYQGQDLSTNLSLSGKGGCKSQPWHTLLALGPSLHGDRGAVHRKSASTILRYFQAIKPV
jgi:hypothetical protein